VPLLALAAGRAGDASLEYQVKAAFIFNFTQFIQWPAAAFAAEDAPFIIATVGDDPSGGAIDQAVAGKKVEKHPVVVKHFADAAHIGECHVLFVPASQDANLPQIMKEVGAKAVLTVGETDAFPKAGGEARFYLDDGKVRFEINPDAAAKAGLKVSAKLLSLARIYKPAP